MTLWPLCQVYYCTAVHRCTHIAKSKDNGRNEALIINRAAEKENILIRL